MAIVIEILDGGGRCIELHKCSGISISLGRSFDNDVTIIDDHVDPNHCGIIARTDQSGFEIEDLDTVNGTLIGRKRLTGERKHIDSGSLIQIGKTQLRVVDPRAPLPAAEKLSPLDGLVDRLSNNWVCFALLLIAALLSAYLSYLHADASMKPSRLLGSIIDLGMTIGIATAFWGTVGKVVRDQAALRFHASLATLSWLIAEVMGLAFQALSYNFNFADILPSIDQVSQGLLLAATQILHLYVATRIRPVGRALIALLIFAFYPGISLYHQFEQRHEFSQDPDIRTQVRPPAWLVVNPINVDRFALQVEQTFDAADDDVKAIAQRERETQQ
jgi:pSer/pThr/pTyr-binding forkhead associated (FHA) protein